MTKPRRKVYYSGTTSSGGELLQSAATVPTMLAAGVDVGVGWESTHAATVVTLGGTASGGSDIDSPNLSAAATAITNLIDADRFDPNGFVILNLEGGYFPWINQGVFRPEDPVAIERLETTIAAIIDVVEAVRYAHPGVTIANWGMPTISPNVPDLGVALDPLNQGETNPSSPPSVSGGWRALDDATFGANQELYISRMVEVLTPLIPAFDMMVTRCYPHNGRIDPENAGRIREGFFVAACMEASRRLKAITGRPICVAAQPVWRAGKEVWETQTEGEYPKDTLIPNEIFGPEYIDRFFDQGADAVQIWWSATHAVNAFSGSGSNSAIQNNRALVKYNLLDPQGIDPGDLSSDTWWQDAGNRAAAFTYGQNFLAARAIDSARRSMRSDVRNAARASTLDAGGIVIGQ